MLTCPLSFLVPEGKVTGGNKAHRPKWRHPLLSAPASLISWCSRVNSNLITWNEVQKFWIRSLGIMQLKASWKFCLNVKYAKKIAWSLTGVTDRDFSKQMLYCSECSTKAATSTQVSNAITLLVCQSLSRFLPGQLLPTDHSSRAILSVCRERVLWKRAFCPPGRIKAYFSWLCLVFIAKKKEVILN